MDLERVYRTETRCKPDGRWSKQTLIAQINKARLRRALSVERERQAEQQRAAKRAEQAARAEQRGDMRTYWSRVHEAKDEENYALAYATRWAIGAIDREQKRLQEFVENAESDLYKALDWSLDLFNTAAEARVARFFEQLFTDGASNEEIVRWMVREQRSASRSVNRSTSPTHNLVEDCYRAAVTEMLERLERY